MTPQDHTNAEMLKRTARERNGGYDRQTYRVDVAHPSWPDEQQEGPAMCATSPDPTWRGVFVNAKEAALIAQVLAAVELRVDDYVDAGYLTGRDAEVVGALLERLQGPMPDDPLTGQSAKAHVLDESEAELIGRIANEENWPEVFGWNRSRVGIWSALARKLEQQEPE